MNKKNLTRGFGLLETFLSVKRMKIAINLIKKHNKKGRILDIGCGNYPFFLKNIDFEEKYGVDKGICDANFKRQNLKLINCDICINPTLPFKQKNFDVITMLAVIEHLDPDQIYKILNNCYFLLKKNGILIITTPAKWSDLILKFMAKINLVSSEEIKEHEGAYTLREINNILLKANFLQEKVQNGYFEFFLNLWICAIK